MMMLEIHNMVGKTQGNGFPTTFGPVTVSGQYDGFIAKFDCWVTAVF